MRNSVTFYLSTHPFLKPIDQTLNYSVNKSFGIHAMPEPVAHVNEAFSADEM